MNSSGSSVSIALRNLICDELAAHFGCDDWLRNPPAPFVWREQEKTRIGESVANAQRAAYEKLGSMEKHAIDDRLFRNGVPVHLSHERRAKIRQPLSR